jgi:hypothetical protein
MASKYEEIEQREGRLMKDILIDLFNQYGDVPNAQEVIAEKLGISQPTLSQWIKFLPVKTKTVLVPVTANGEGGDQQPVAS